MTRTVPSIAHCRFLWPQVPEGLAHIRPALERALADDICVASYMFALGPWVEPTKVVVAKGGCKVYLYGERFALDASSLAGMDVAALSAACAAHFPRIWLIVSDAKGEAPASRSLARWLLQKGRPHPRQQSPRRGSTTQQPTVARSTTEVKR